MGPSPSDVTAVIAAAGSGERLGAGGPKAFARVGGRPLVAWSIEAMRASPSVAAVVVACPPGVRLGDIGAEGPQAGAQPVVPEAPGDGATAGEPAGAELIEVDGGATRAQSVANALAAVETELVVIHDAARPLVTAELVEAVLATLAADPEASGAIAATPLTDTVKLTSAALSTHNGVNAALVADEPLAIESTVDRDRLWAAQTPQVFRTDALRRALESASDPEAATDEAMLVEAAGGRVLIHPSPPENLKVTTPLDLRLAELLLADR
jgi:2-C-methyl-D-erythritol 4-phosphate cytidylyltransferase